MENLLITPEGIYVDGEHSTCSNIVLVLPDGQALDINTAISYLQKKYKPSKPKIPSKLSRIREILTAADVPPPHPSPTASTQNQSN